MIPHISMSQHPFPSYLLELDVLILPVWETVSALFCSVYIYLVVFQDIPLDPRIST